jgi:hypothetical protein
VNALKEGRPVMSGMALTSTSARAIVDKSDLRNSRKAHAVWRAVVSTPLWLLLAATADEVMKHAEGILQQQYLLATRAGDGKGYSCVCTDEHMWHVRQGGPSYDSTTLEDSGRSPLPRFL